MNRFPQNSILAVRSVAPAMLLVSLSIPLLFLGRPGIVGADLEENRMLAKIPPLPASLSDYVGIPAAFDHYVLDNFGMRNLLIRFNARLKYGVLGTSPTAKVLVGKDGWMFLKGRSNMLDYAGQRAVSEADLRRWRIVLEERRDWLKARNVTFGVAVAPAKQSIYEEFMPAYMGRRSAGAALDRFLAHMAGRSDVIILDLRIPLREAGKDHGVYFKTDSHWNSRGALAAYRYIAGAFPDIFGADRILDYPELVAAPRRHRTNLLAMMGIRGTEATMEFERSAGWRARTVGAGDGQDSLKRETGITRISEIDDPALRRALFIVDSFFAWNSRFFSEHFRRLVAVNRFNVGWKLKDAFPVEIIETEQPHFVLMQIVEGHLHSCSKPLCLASSLIEANPPGVRQARLQRLFADSEYAPARLELAEVARGKPMPQIRGGPATEPAWRIVFAAPSGEQPRCGPCILRLGVAADQGILIRSAVSRKSVCHANQEVTDVQVGAETSEVFLCVDEIDRNGRTELHLLGNAAGVRFRAAEAVMHGDIGGA